MGVDTTTNPSSHTQAQSVIKAQKGGGSPRVPPIRAEEEGNRCEDG